jgi:hypothetical protein
MVEANKITFPEKYDNKGYLNILEIDKGLMERSESAIREKLDKKNLSIEKYEEQLEEELSMIDSAKTTLYQLSADEEVALVQIDAMKEEIVNICRTKRDSGKDSFKLPAYKDADTGASEANMHDDRAYCLALAGYYLQEKRLEHIRKRKKDIGDVNQFFEFKRPKTTHSYFNS